MADKFTLGIFLLSTLLRLVICIYLHQLLHLPLIIYQKYDFFLLWSNQFIPIFLNLIHKLPLKTNLPILHIVANYFLRSNSFHDLLSHQSGVYFPGLSHHVVEIFQEFRVIESCAILVDIHKIVIALH